MTGRHVYKTCRPVYFLETVCILKCVQDNGLAEIVVYNLRDYTTDKHHKVDDYTFGGEADMEICLNSYSSVVNSLYKSTGPKCQYLVLSVDNF